jgi:hypothetical protein
MYAWLMASGSLIGNDGENLCDIVNDLRLDPGLMLGSLVYPDILSWTTLSNTGTGAQSTRRSYMDLVMWATSTLFVHCGSMVVFLILIFISNEYTRYAPFQSLGYVATSSWGCRRTGRPTGR